jgi:Family of unknown function (DUF6615)
MISSWSEFVTPRGAGPHLSLCRTFDDIAVRTHGWLTMSRKPRLVPGETAITDLNLFELWKRHRHQVGVWRMTAAQESATGADWEWWLGGAGRWFALRVQAKKLDDRGVEYRGLRAKAGTRSQIDVLIEAAARSRWTPVPAYCFYNGTPSIPVSWRGGCRHGLLAQVFGCTFALAPAVRAAPSNRVDDVGRCSVPWSDLVCCAGGSLADRVAGVVRRLQGEPSLHAEMPDYVRLVQAGELLDGDPRVPEGVVGILVVEQQEFGVV